MSDNKTSYDYKNRNLSEVFKELQSIQSNSNSEHPSEELKTRQSNNNFGFNFNAQNANLKSKHEDLKLSHIIIGCSILVVSMGLFFPKSTSFRNSYAREEVSTETIEYELNRHSLNIQSIISENAGIDRVKEQVIEEREVEFETTYNDSPTLPKGEEVITQEGILGRDKVTAVKTYENGNFVEEIILSKDKIVDPTPKLINLGTSEFLAKHKVHIGDTMYFVDTAKLKQNIEDTSPDVAEVKKSLDVIKKYLTHFNFLPRIKTFITNFCIIRKIFFEK